MFFFSFFNAYTGERIGRSSGILKYWKIISKFNLGNSKGTFADLQLLSAMTLPVYAQMKIVNSSILHYNTCLLYVDGLKNTTTQKKILLVIFFRDVSTIRPSSGEIIFNIHLDLKVLLFTDDSNDIFHSIRLRRLIERSKAILKRYSFKRLHLLGSLNWRERMRKIVVRMQIIIIL